MGRYSAVYIKLQASWHPECETGIEAMAPVPSNVADLSWSGLEFRFPGSGSIDFRTMEPRCIPEIVVYFPYRPKVGRAPCVPRR